MGRASAATKPQKRDADTKVAQSRLSVLELAKELGNVDLPLIFHPAVTGAL